MSRFVELFNAQVESRPHQVAFCNSDSASMTYTELGRAADALGAHYCSLDPDKNPVVVYGHKDPYMLAGILACMKSGRAYVPADSAFPLARVADICDQLGGCLLLDTAGAGLTVEGTHAGRVIGRDEAQGVVDAWDGSPLPIEQSVAGDDFVYIMFTSGSTGRPKGVQMHAAAIDHFMAHFVRMLDAKPEDMFFDRAPFSFDTSVFDLIAGLAVGSTLYALETAADSSMPLMFEEFARRPITKWISTPSLLEACLLDPAYGTGLLPKLELVIVTGEALRAQTAARMLERFPGLRLINAYGATETQSACEMDITAEVIEECEVLPVGWMDPGMRVIIRDQDTADDLPQGEIGEIYLVGPTVSKGYFGRPDLTAASFSEVPDGAGGIEPCYKTGDRGYIDGKGRLYCLGRLDYQVKVNGYRIEAGDIEENLCGLPEVRQAGVVPVRREDGSAAYLCAFVQLEDPAADRSFKQTKNLKSQLKELLPDYMIPRTFRYVDDFPKSTNDKIDRKELARMAAEK